MFGRTSSYKGVIFFICFVWGGLLIFHSLHTILSRALIELDGTIIEEYHPDSPRKHRGYYCTYIFKISNRKDTVRYVAWGADDSLPLDLPVGTKIEKKKWEITYKLNGEIVKDFNLRHYIIIGCMGLFLAIAGLIYLAYRLYLRLSYGD